MFCTTQQYLQSLLAPLFFSQHGDRKYEATTGKEQWRNPNLKLSLLSKCSWKRQPLKATFTWLSLCRQARESHYVFIPAVNRKGHIKIFSLWTLMHCDSVRRGIPHVGWAFHFGFVRPQSAHTQASISARIHWEFHKLLILPHHSQRFMNWHPTVPITYTAHLTPICFI